MINHLVVQLHGMVYKAPDQLKLYIEVQTIMVMHVTIWFLYK